MADLAAATQPRKRSLEIGETLRNLRDHQKNAPGYAGLVASNRGARLALVRRHPSRGPSYDPRCACHAVAAACRVAVTVQGKS